MSTRKAIEKRTQAFNSQKLLKYQSASQDSDKPDETAANPSPQKEEAEAADEEPASLDRQESAELIAKSSSFGEDVGEAEKTEVLVDEQTVDPPSEGDSDPPSPFVCPNCAKADEALAALSQQMQEALLLSESRLEELLKKDKAISDLEAALAAQKASADKQKAELEAALAAQIASAQKQKNDFEAALAAQRASAEQQKEALETALANQQKLFEEEKKKLELLLEEKRFDDSVSAAKIIRKEDDEKEPEAADDSNDDDAVADDGRSASEGASGGRSGQSQRHSSLQAVFPKVTDLWSDHSNSSVSPLAVGYSKDRQNLELQQQQQEQLLQYAAERQENTDPQLSDDFLSSPGSGSVSLSGSVSSKGRRFVVYDGPGNGLREQLNKMSYNISELRKCIDAKNHGKHVALA